MSSKYPLSGYSFLIIQNDVIAVTGDIIQGHGADAYLVRFNTAVPYTRVMGMASPLFNDMNLFETKDQLGDFVELFHKEAEPSAANDVGLDEEDDNVVALSPKEPEDVDNPAVA